VLDVGLKVDALGVAARFAILTPPLVPFPVALPAFALPSLGLQERGRGTGGEQTTSQAV